MVENHTEEEYLSLFLRTVEEYKIIADMIPCNLEKNVYLGIEDSDEAAVSVRSFLLRKFITRSDNVHIGKIIKKAIKVLPEKEQILQELYNVFVEKYTEGLIQVDSTGKESNLREVFDDVIYGIYLHADFERVERLDTATNISRYLLMRRLVSSMEAILFELVDIIKESKPELLKARGDLEKAVVIRNFQLEQSDKKGEGYWENLVVEELDEDTKKEIIENKSQQDSDILDITKRFMYNLIDRKISYDDMKNIVYLPTIDNWKGFSDVCNYVNSLTGCGIGSTVKYNEYGDVAHVKILNNVGNGFLITKEQSIPADIVTLIVDEKTSQWRVISFGGSIDPLANMRD